MAPPFKTTPEEQDFVRLWMPEFMLRKGRKELEDFWPKMRAAYLNEWPEELRLSLPLQQVVHDPNAEKPPPLTDKQRARLDEALTARFKQLRNSFYNAYSKIRNQRGGVSRSPVSLAAMLFKAWPKIKRRHQVLEVYQMVYRDKIKAALKKSQFDKLNEAAQCRDEDGEWIDDDDDKTKMERVKDARRTRMKIQRRVVQEEWDAEAEVVKQKMREMAKKEVAAPAADEDDEDGKTKERTPEAYQMSIDESGPVTEMFLAEFHRMTGWMGVLAYGGPVPRAGGELGVKSVCFGNTPAGLNFERFHPHWKKGVTTPLFRFLRQAIHSVAVSLQGEDNSDVDEEEAGLTAVDGEAATPPKKAKKKRSKDKTDAPVANAEVIAVAPSMKPARRPKPKPKPKAMPAVSEDEGPKTETHMVSTDTPHIDLALTALQMEEDLVSSEWPDNFDPLGGGGEPVLSASDDFTPFGSPHQFLSSHESHPSLSNVLLLPPSETFVSNDFLSDDLLLGVSASPNFPPSTSQDLHVGFDSSTSHGLSRSNLFVSHDLLPWNGWRGSFGGDWAASQAGGSMTGSSAYTFPLTFGLTDTNTLTPTDPSILGFAPPAPLVSQAGTFATPLRPIPRRKDSFTPFSFSREPRYRLESPTGSTSSTGSSVIGSTTPTPTGAPAVARSTARPVVAPSGTPARTPLVPPPPASTPKRLASAPAKSSPLARPPLQAPVRPAAPPALRSATPPPSGSLPPRLRPSPIRQASSSVTGALPPAPPPRAPIFPQSRPMANAPKKPAAKLSPGAVAKKMAGVRAAKQAGEKKAGAGKKAIAKRTTVAGAVVAGALVVGVAVAGATAAGAAVAGATVAAATVEPQAEVQTVRPQEPLPTYSSSNNNARRLREEKAREAEETTAAAARKAPNMRLHNPAGNHDLFITQARPQRTILPPKNRGAVLSLKEKTAALEAKLKADDDALLGALAAGKKRKAPAGENTAPATKRSKVAKGTPASGAAEMGPEAKAKKTAVGRGKRK
ncbi:hypothetical protein DFH09DRAFT_1338412 [Mycena vulgaris]|nr:hypothetical protein DFH09DRAFT_1338412 [Mycena vulgaris]